MEINSNPLANVARLVELESTTLPRKSELSGGVGFVDDAIEMAKEVLGKGKVGETVGEYGKILAGARAEQKDAEVSVSADEKKADRLSGGVAGAAEIVHSLEASSELSPDFLANLGVEITQASTAMEQNIESHKQYVDKFKAESKEQYADAMEAEKNMLASMTEMWKFQDNLDDIHEAQVAANSYDDNNEDTDWKVKGSGGAIRRFGHWVKGIPGNIVERAKSAVSPRTARKGEVEATYAKVSEYIKLNGGEAEVSKLTEKGFFEKKTAMKARLAMAEEYVKGKEQGATAEFRETRKNWIVDSVEAVGKRSVALPGMKTAMAGIEVGLSFVDLADGSIGVSVESAESWVANHAMNELVAAQAGKEVVAAKLKSAISENGNDKAQLAQAYRGAEVVWGRALAGAARAASIIEESKGGISGAIGAGVGETIDIATGGITRGEKVNGILNGLTERMNRLDGTTQAIVETTEDDKKTADGLVAEVVKGAKVPKSMMSENSWRDSLLNPFGLGEKAVRIFDKVVTLDFGNLGKNELVRTLVDGSYRKFLDKTLGAGVYVNDGGEMEITPDREGGLFHRMTRAAAVERVAKEKVVEAKVDTVEGLDSVAEAAAAISLQSAQTKFLEQECKQMRRRSELDRTWTVVAGALVAMGGAVLLGEGAKQMELYMRTMSSGMETQLGALKANLESVTKILDAAKDASTYTQTVPDVGTIQNWAVSAGEGQQSGIINELGKVAGQKGWVDNVAMFANNTRTVAGYLAQVGGVGYLLASMTEVIKSTVLPGAKRVGFGRAQATL